MKKFTKRHQGRQIKILKKTYPKVPNLAWERVQKNKFILGMSPTSN